MGNSFVMRFAWALVLAAALAALIAPDAVAIRFADAPCPEAGAGGIRSCPAGVVGTLYAIKLDGAGGCGPDPSIPGSGLPYQFTPLGGELPPGLSLRRDGLLSGVPTRAGSWSFWIQLSDENPPSASWCIPKKSEREFNVRVDAPRATVGVPYSVGVAARGEGPQAWSLASGRLPPGLILDPASGTIAGTPQLPGSFPLTLAAVDSRGRTASVDLVIFVARKLEIATTRLAPVKVGRLYRATVRTTGGVGPVKLRVVSGRFPVGVRLNVATGALTGTPRKAGIYRMTIEARDAVGAAARRTFVLTVRRHLA